MARKNGWLAELISLPWWLGAILTVVVYTSLRFLLPLMIGGSVYMKTLVTAVSSNAHLFAFPFALGTIASAVMQWHRARLLDSRRDIESIRALDWRDFELLIHEVFRRLGYAVEPRGGAGPDGGIDLVLSKNGEQSIVQCKHWKARQVGVREVRELYGVQTAEGASFAYLVTTGTFTPDALGFAAGKPMHLCDGSEVAGLVDELRHGSVKDSTPEVEARIDAPTPTSDSANCPTCGAAMKKRIAKRGSNPGQIFWGCSTYPRCLGTRPA